MNPRGLDFVRICIARAIAASNGEPLQAGAYAANRWGARSTAALITKAGVAAGSPDGWGAELVDLDAARTEFFELARSQALIGRMTGLRRVPRRTPFVAVADGSTASWRGHGKAARASRSMFEGSSLDTLTATVLQVVSKELLGDISAQAETLIRSDMLNAARLLLDRSFIDESNAGTPGLEPAAVTYDAPTIPSSGNITEDVAAALAQFSGDLSTAVWVAHPRTGVDIGLHGGGKGLAVDVGARGGTLAGLPVMTSEAATHDSSGGTISLVDAAGVCLLDEGGSVNVSTEAMIELDDAPTGDAAAPAAATATRMSLWQADLVGLLLSWNANWKKAREGSVVVITGAHYG